MAKEFCLVYPFSRLTNFNPLVVKHNNLMDVLRKLETFGTARWRFLSPLEEIAWETYGIVPLN
jgi:hypothetical protein